MKLSVLIPTFNFDCRHLVEQLLPQMPTDSEIIVGDDCSTDEDVAKAIGEIGCKPKCRVFRPQHNLGRAAIRNALAREAKGEWLLFIDADAEVRSLSYISDYMEATKDAEVVCGGTANMHDCPRPAARLRYDYEVAAEKRLSLAHRRSNPYYGFTTFNFLIRRSTFLSILFDERLKRYGHEDTLFGLELKRRGIKILHIDNKLTHTGLEDADAYLQKTETALRTLSTMSREQQENVRTSAMVLRLRRLHLLGVLRLLFKAMKPFLRRNLLGEKPSQTLFAFYKLGYYSVLV